MLIWDGSGQLLVEGRGSKSSTSQAGLIAITRKVGGFGELVALILDKIQAMKSAMLILELGQAQSVLQAQGNLWRTIIG